jgi:hypothetical protein
LAKACQDLSTAAFECARQMAQKDALAVEAYLRCHDKIKSSSSRRLRSSSKRGITNTSPLKSPASSRVVPWVRHVSMPLADTIETKALKATVEDKPIEKEAMALAVKSVLDSRQRSNSSAITPAPANDDDDAIAVLPLKKKKKKTSAKAVAAAANDSKTADDKKVKKIKKKKTKETVVTSDGRDEDVTNATKDTTDLEDNETRSLEKEVTSKKEVPSKKDLAKKEIEKLRLLANKMSFGFDESAATKEKISSKGAALLSATLQDTPKAARLKQTSVKTSKTSSKRRMKKCLGSSLSDLNNVSSDFSTAPHVLESSTSSFEYDDEVIIKETTKATDRNGDASKAEQHHDRKKLRNTLFPRVFRQPRRQQQQRQQPDQFQEASCHF